jgi:hypothetical protein
MSLCGSHVPDQLVKALCALYSLAGLQSSAELAQRAEQGASPWSQAYKPTCLGLCCLKPSPAD